MTDTDFVLQDPPTYVSARNTMGRTEPAAALAYLGPRLGLSLEEPFITPTDPRHELAVALVDIAARLLWLHDQVADAAAVGAKELHQLSTWAQHRQTTIRTGSSLDDDVSVVPAAQRVAQLVARIEEQEHALNIVGCAYRAAWHNQTARDGRVNGALTPGTVTPTD
jgi:hypothetical protein